jgi:predicted aspartyl protease
VTPKLIRLRVTKDRGLLLTSWINGKGPYVFAVDTGAGMNLVTQRVVSEAQLPWRSTRRTTLGGLTSAATVSNREVVLNELALGEMRNTFGAKTALVVSLLAPGIDGILDPTDIYSPYGYSIDMPNQRLAGLETTTARGLRPLLPGEGAVVPWLRFESSARPFVRLGDGRLALIDTGSGFGLAVNERDAVIVGPRRSNQSSEATLDVAGGTITSQRVAPTTITIGDLVLRRVPTDILFGVSDDAPVILGRDVLYPFKITFDPQRRSIEFHTSEKS